MNVQIDKATIDKITKDLQEGGFEDHSRSGFLTGKINGDDILVDGIYVPKQESTRGNTLIDAGTTVKVCEEIRASGKDVVGIGHYNGANAVFESVMNFAARKAHADQGIPAVSVVTNKKGDYEIFSK